VAITSKTLAVTWQDGSETTGRSYIVTKRLISDTVLSMDSQADLASLRTAASAKPLTPLTTFSTSNPASTMRVRSFAVQPVNQEGKIFDATITYGTEYFWAEVGSPGTPQLILPVSVAFQAAERQVAIYRNPSFTTNPSANLNTTADIGGTSVDEEGRPVEGTIPANMLGISLVFDVSQTGKTLVGVYDDVDLVRGKWNSASFLHWGANQVYCQDADVSHIRDEFYRVTYRIRWDTWFGCEQVPNRDNDNVIRLNSNGKATTVYWRSISRSTANLDSIIFDIAPNATMAKQIALEGSWLTFP